MQEIATWCSAQALAMVDGQAETLNQALVQVGRLLPQARLLKTQPEVGPAPCNGTVQSNLPMYVIWTLTI